LWSFALAPVDANRFLPGASLNPHKTTFPTMTEYARGLAGVIANESALSNVIGDVGELSYLGYHIDDLVANCSYEEVVYLLHKGRLPNQGELEAFSRVLRTDRDLPAGVIDFLKNAPKEAVPMDVLRTGVSMLGLYDKRAKVGEPDLEEAAAVALSLVAKVPVLVAAYHRFRQGLELPPVRDDMSEAEHFLYLINGQPAGEVAVKTLDVALILHADHGMNASTFSARVTVATLSDMYSAITSAIGTLKGPLHGGANEGVIHMLQEIGEPEKVDEYVEGKLSRKEKIMGIGHRIYRTLDPRAPHLRKLAIQLTEELGEPKWIRMSERIAEIMRERKGLEANVDFYSATVYYSLGIPTDLFTPIFAIARTSGWTAQVLEQLRDNRLYRPLTLYTGPSELMPVPPIETR
jgi:citrate synthase